MHVGPLPPGSVSSIPSLGAQGWDTPSNAIGSDNVKTQAMVLYPGSRQTQILQAVNPNPADLADDAAVTKVTVNVERSANNSGGSPKDAIAKLYVGGILQSDDQSNTNTWTTSDTVVSYVFAVNLTGAQVKSSDFGFGLAVGSSGAKYHNVVKVDSITFEFDC